MKGGAVHGGVIYIYIHTYTCHICTRMCMYVYLLILVSSIKKAERTVVACT